MKCQSHLNISGVNMGKIDVSDINRRIELINTILKYCTDTNKKLYESILDIQDKRVIRVSRS